MPNREQQARVTVILDGVNLGVWDLKTGGETDSNSSQYFLGGMGPRISLGGTQQVANVLVTKLQDTDLTARKKWITSRAGKGAVTVTEQSLDDEGVAWGEPDVYQGVLKKANPADYNAQSNNPRLFQIEVEISGPMA